MQPEIQGWTDPRFNEVRRTFEHSVSNYDAGAAFSVYVDGDCVVDLWGGHADTAQNRLWEKDTAVFMMSGSKGVLAAALARAATIGLIDYRTPVAHYWPEFAAEGKAEITVSQCVTYIGGLPGFVEPVSQLDLMDSPRIADMLARQAPARPGTLLYGPYALGFVVDELFRRTAGVDASEFFHREIALPHDIRIAWGEQYERHGWGTLATIEYESAFEHQYDDYVNSTDPLTKMIWANPAPFPLGDRVWNTPERRARPLAAANCAAPAREIAKLYDVLSRDLRGLNGSAGLIDY
ncbi:MAG TPA: serine hydrolase domain-containing protein, partial [Lentzea sp.]